MRWFEILCDRLAGLSMMISLYGTGILLILLVITAIFN
jgi:hypothetical protein